MADVIDGGGVSDPDGTTTDTTTDPTTPAVDGVYGVTVGHVRQLATHVGFNPSFSDPDFGPVREQITDNAIGQWIILVAESVTARMSALERYRTDTGRWAAATGSARTAVTNGAASYLVSAAYPAKAGTNDQSNYSAELWGRYQAELNFLTSLPIAWTDEDTAAAKATGRTRATYTPSRFPDAVPGPFSLWAPSIGGDQARYLAPGTEDGLYR